MLGQIENPRMSPCIALGPSVSARPAALAKAQQRTVTGLRSPSKDDMGVRLGWAGTRTGLQSLS